MERIYLASPHMSEEGYEKEYINDAFQKNWIAPLGENVNQFEKEIEGFVGAKYAAALSSGTAAIHMAVKAAGIQKGDIVLCQSLTFSASVNPVIYEGGIPVFIDSEKDTWNMDPKALEKAFEKYPNAKAVIVVNLYGNPAKLDEIKEICDQHHVVLIEDAAESLGSKFQGRYTGNFGKYGIFSFNGNKIITTSGGGMLISDDEEKVQKVIFWATQAREKELHYEHKEIGYNYRLSNICAGIGRGQLKVLNQRIAQKTAIYDKYREELEKDCFMQMIPVPNNSVPNHWLSVALINSEKTNITPKKIVETLQEKNIESRRVWKPMHLQPVFEKYDFIKVEENSVAEELFEKGICLPSDTKMTEEKQNLVITEVEKCMKNI